MMKSLLKLGMALLIAAMLFGIAGCFEPEDEDGEETGGSSGGVDYKNYLGTDQALGFRNGTPNKVVLFAGSLEKSNIIGGLAATGTNASYVSKSKNTKHFSATQAFQVIAVTEQQYKDSKGKPDTIEYPLARIYVFYNKDGTNNKIYDIDGRLGGQQNYINIIMPLTGSNSWSAEFRDGGTSGPGIGYAPQGILQTRLYVLPQKDFNLFPVFHRWNSMQEVLEIAYPLNEMKEAWQVDFALGDSQPTYEINMRTALQGVKDQKPNVGAAYVVVNNQVVGSMIRMTKGGQPVTNALGVSLFGPGEKTLQFDMTKVGGGNSVNFSNSVAFSGYSVGMTGNEQPVTYMMDEGETVPVEVFLENGKIYMLSVSGSNSNPAAITPRLYLTTTGGQRVQDFEWE